MILRHTLLCLTLMITSCTSMESPETPPSTVEQLTGIWSNSAHHASLHFYSDETVKLIFPKHQPPVKMISSYQTIKGENIGIALGGFWTGPMMVNITELQQGKLKVSFPDEESILFQR